MVFEPAAPADAGKKIDGIHLNHDGLKQLPLRCTVPVVEMLQEQGSPGSRPSCPPTEQQALER